MNLKKSGLILVLLFLVSMFVVSCDDNTGPDDDIFGNIWEKMLSIGKLEFLNFDGDNDFVGFVRILVGILVFAIFFGVLNGVHEWVPRNIAITIAAVLAIMTAIFIPGSVLAGIGAAYGTLFSIILVGAPAVLLGLLIYKIPSEHASYIVIRLIIILLAILMLNAAKSHALDLLYQTGGGWLTSLFS